MKILKNSLKMRNPSTAEFEAINGFVGESGVHVGPEMPFGSGVDLWINPTNTDTYTVAEMDDLNKVINYSTEEVLTGGTWIDGKPIYKKTYQSSISTTAVDVSIGTIENVKNIVKAYGCLNSTDNNLLILNNYWSNTWYAVVYVKPNTNSVLANCSKTGTINVTIEYTKTTD